MSFLIFQISTLRSAALGSSAIFSLLLLLHLLLLRLRRPAAARRHTRTAVSPGSAPPGPATRPGPAPPRPHLRPAPPRRRAAGGGADVGHRLLALPLAALGAFVTFIQIARERRPERHPERRRGQVRG